MNSLNHYQSSLEFFTSRVSSLSIPRQMHSRISILCLVLVHLTKTEAFAAAPEPLTEKTYCVGRTESSGKLYHYSRLLSVEMLRRADASFEFTYRITDDQGKPLESKSGRLALKSKELSAFITICQQAWNLVYNRSEVPPSGSMAMLGKFHGEDALYLCDAYGTSHLIIKQFGATQDKPASLSLPMEGVCATLSLLSQTDAGKKQLGDGNRFRAGIKKEPATTPFREQEEIDLSGSIVRKFGAGNWDTWKGRVIYAGLDFGRLSDKERQYLSKVFARHGSPSGAKLRINSDASFIVRLKLNDPETLNDLREAFSVGYFYAADAADACRLSVNARVVIT